MKFIFVIQQLLQTCQGHRLYGPLDGVKNTSKPVNFCFTLAHLSSCINHIISGFRVMLAFSFVLALSISTSLAQTLTLTGSLNSSSVSCATLAGYTTLNIGDGTIATTWTIDNDLDLSACPNPLTIVINDNAYLKIVPGQTLSLPNGFNIRLNGTGYIWKENPCSASQIIYIGSIKIASCNGGGGGDPLNTFDQINEFGGTGNASSNSPVCIGSTIYLTAIPSTAGYTYAWTGPSGFLSTLQNPSLSPAIAGMTGEYIVKITNTITTKSIVAATNVTVDLSITNNITGGTSPICSSSMPALLTGAPSGGNGTFTYLWESSTSGSTTGFSPANGINTTQTYQPGALTQTTWFRRNVTSGCNSISAPIGMIVTPNLPVSISIAASTNPVCEGIPVTFTTILTNGGATPAYQWKKGGIIIPSEISDSYTSTTLAGNDKITVAMTSSATCTSGNPATSNEITVSVTPTVGTPVFILGASSARDQGAVPVTYTATASNNTGITYSLDAASLTGGNTIDANTGVVTYTALWSWKSIITATAQGCNGPKTADHVVGVNWCYALFTANGALSCAGASTITGNVGTFVGATTGFTGPGILVPPGHIDAEATPASAQAAAQAVSVYNDLAAIPCSETHSEITLAGPTTLTPKVYCYDGALTISGDITLDGLGNPNAVFIFKINGALTTEKLSHIKLTGLANFRNVYWRVYGAVVLSGLEFKGTIVNEGAFTVNTGVALEGRALSINGAIAITDNVITSDCYPLFTEIDNTKPIFVPPADIIGCVENLTSAVFDPLTIDINPNRPDYYTYSDVDTRLDLNTALFTDDEPLACPSNIRWEIDFSPASDFNPPYNLVTQPPITGIGQPSAHIGNILFPGDGVNFNSVAHHITWWIKDCAGNESPPQTRTITINPRPKIVKIPL